MQRRRARWIAWLACLAAVSCTSSERPTQIVVWIRADSRVAPTLARVEVGLYPATPSVEGEGEGDATHHARFEVTNGEPMPGEYRLPFSFSIAKGEADDFKLSARAYTSRTGDAAPVIEHTTDVHFEPHRTLELTLLFAAADLHASPDAASAAGAPASPPPSAAGSPAQLDADAGPGVQACASGAGVCDPVSQCGCSDSAHCQVDADLSVCAQPGTTAIDRPCQRNRECAAGSSCQNGACRRACRTSDDCRDRWSLGSMSTCIKPSGAHFGWCGQPCAIPDAPACETGLTCSPLQIGAVRDSFCLRVESPCTSIENGECDEAGIGTGLCAYGTDARDCCDKPRMDGACDLVTQCGCPKGKACQALDLFPTATPMTACRDFGERPAGSPCDAATQCGKGMGCFGRMCKVFCQLSENACPSGKCSVVVFNGRESKDVGACETHCEFDTGKPCGPGAVCAQLGTGSTCFVQPAICPRQNDRVCDETSRLCAAGTDSADCGRDDLQDAGA